MNTIAKPRFRKLTVPCVLVALAPLALDGCLSIGVDQFPSAKRSAENLCTLEARLYETGKDAKRDVKSTRDATWKLFNLDSSPVVPVQQGTGPVWSATDLKAGKYRLAASWGPKPGTSADTSAGSSDTTFALAAGETARVDVVLSKFAPWGWVAIGVGSAAIITAVAVAVGSSAMKGVATGLSGGRSVSTRGPEPATGTSSTADRR